MPTMPSPLNDLAAWRNLTPPIRIGPVTTDTVTLDDLSTPDGYQRVKVAMADPEQEPRSVLLAPLHLAHWTISTLLGRPCFHDRAWISAGPRQLGLDLEPAGDMPTFWLAPDVEVTGPPGPSAVGGAIGELLAPVADVVARCSRIHESAVRTIAAESAIGGLFWAARSAGWPDERDWLETASAALGLALDASVSSARVLARPDAGPDVVSLARSLCCVLHTDASCHGCPGCPKKGDLAEQTRDITQWLAGMDQEQFLETTGRAKQPGGRPGENG